MFQNILFDLDGTISDSGAGIIACVQYALEHMGIRESDPDRLRAFVGPPLLVQMQRGYGMDEAQAARAVAKYRERYASQGILENEMYPGVGEMLQKLHAAGKRLALATSKPQPFARQILERYGVAQYFTCIVGATLDGRINTKIEVLQETLQQLDIRTPQARAQTVMVGDREYDIDGAHHFGLTAIGVEYGYADPGELQRHGADVILPTVSALERYLLEH